MSMPGEKSIFQGKKCQDTLLLSSCSKMCDQAGIMALFACKGGKSLLIGREAVSEEEREGEEKRT